MRAIDASVLQGSELYREVILDKLAHARESVLIATANVKDMQVERGGKFGSVLSLLSELAGRGVELRLLHAELPSRPFRASFEKRRRLTQAASPSRSVPACTSRRWWWTEPGSTSAARTSPAPASARRARASATSSWASAPRTSRPSIGSRPSSKRSGAARSVRRAGSGASARIRSDSQRPARWCASAARAGCDAELY